MDDKIPPISLLPPSGMPNRSSGSGSGSDLQDLDELDGVIAPVDKSDTDDDLYIHASTGGSFNLSGTYGFEKHLSGLAKSHRATYMNLSQKDRKFFSDLVSSHARKLPTGSSFSYQIRKQMKQQVESAKHGGHISHSDAKDIKKMIDHLN